MRVHQHLGAALAVLLATGVQAIIYDYNGIALPPSSVLVSTHGLYGASNGVSAFVKTSLSFSQGYNSAGRPTAPEKLQVIFLKMPASLDSRTFYGPTTMRCTKEGPGGGLIDAEHLGSVDNVVNVTVTNGVGHIETEFPVVRDGKYAVVFARCHKSDVLVYLNGKVEWMSEYGELPGEYMNLLPFYGLLTTVYFIVVLTWLYHFWKYYDETITLQLCIFGVLVFNFIETALCFANYLQTNSSGKLLNTGALWFTAEVFRVVADTVCRTFILLMCLGLNIITDRLSTRTWSAVYCFTGVYMALKMVDHLNIDSAAQYSEALLGLDIILLVWLFSALVDAENKLSDEDTMTPNAELKKELYQGIRFLLIMFLFVTAICFTSLYNLYNILPWTWTWIRHSFEDCIVFLITFYISIAWLPSASSSMYAPIAIELQVRTQSVDED
eukprot:g2489.t1